MFREETLFTAIAGPLFGGALKPAQREGIRTILACWRKEADAGPPAALAYVLATALHETAGTMQPVAEYGGAAYKTRLYDVRGSNPQRAIRQGNDQPGDGVRYAGRGYVQLTWKNNYRLAGEKLGIDLVAAPDRALEPEIAALILVRGMLAGWFSGRRLGQYITATTADFVRARAIVNGTDKAQAIAAKARLWLTGLRTAAA